MVLTDSTVSGVDFLHYNLGLCGLEFSCVRHLVTIDGDFLRTVVDLEFTTLLDPTPPKLDQRCHPLTKKRIYETTTAVLHKQLQVLDRDLVPFVGCLKTRLELCRQVLYHCHFVVKQAILADRGVRHSHTFYLESKVRLATEAPLVVGAWTFCISDNFFRLSGREGQDPK